VLASDEFAAAAITQAMRIVCVAAAGVGVFWCGPRESERS
jgi:hypothetical protein